MRISDWSSDVCSSDLPTLSELVASGVYGMRGVPGGNLGMDDYIDSVNLDNFSGGFNVKEVFAETLVPLLSGMTMVQQLNLAVAARWADYSGSGTGWAWKARLPLQVTHHPLPRRTPPPHLWAPR